MKSFDREQYNYLLANGWAPAYAWAFAMGIYSI